MMQKGASKVFIVHSFLTDVSIKVHSFKVHFEFSADASWTPENELCPESQCLAEIVLGCISSNNDQAI